MTEAGLKLGFLVALGPTPGVRVESERPASFPYRDKRRRMDVVLIDETNMCALVVELKYVRCAFFKDIRYSAHEARDRPDAWHEKLNVAARDLSQDWNEAQHQEFLNPDEKERRTGRMHIPLSSLAEAAQHQAAGYADSVTRNNQPILVDGERVIDIASCTVIGVATLCFLNP